MPTALDVLTIQHVWLAAQATTTTPVTPNATLMPALPIVTLVSAIQHVSVVAQDITTILLIPPATSALASQTALDA